jgi:hypothetical protein
MILRTWTAVFVGVTGIVWLSLTGGCAGSKERASVSRIDRAMAAAERRTERPAAAVPQDDHPVRGRWSGRLVRLASTAAPGDRFDLAPLTLASTDPASPATVGTESGAYGGVETASISPAGRAALSDEPVFSLKQDLKDTPTLLWRDTKRVYTNPVGLGLLLTAGGASLALRPHVDETIEDKFDRAHTCSEGWRDTADVLGHPLLHLGLAGAWYATGLRAEDAKTYNVGKALLSALIINDLSTVALKVAANASRPNGDNLGWPSGHTSSSFALASVMHRSYGAGVGVPLYALAGWVAFERMDDREHFFSDVVFGGVMGLVIGHTVAEGHLPEIAGGVVLPYSDPSTGSTGIAWCKSMK